MTETNRGVLLKGPNDYALAELPRPDLADGEALLAVKSATICGSDLKMLRGRMEGAGYPLVLGHEYSGEVVDARGASKAWIGRRVVSDVLQACGSCAACRRSMHNLCADMVEPGINADGAFADYAKVRVRHLVALPEGLPFEHAALIEPLAAVLYALERAAMEPGHHVVIFGGGGIGQLLLQATRRAGAAHITLLDPHPRRRELATALGADRIADPRAEGWRDRIGVHPPLEPRYVFEAAGDTDAFTACLEIVAPGGIVAVIGYPPSGLRATIDPGIIMRKRIDVRGVLSPTGHWEEATAALAAGEIRAAPLLTHRFPLARFEEAFALAAKRADGAVRVSLVPGVPGG